MITVEEAKSILIENTFRSEKTCKKKIEDSSGYFLAENMYSDFDLPSFNQSNVDGYAVSISGSNAWTVKEEIKAGDNPKIKLGKNEAARIFTGAVVPDGADCVLMQEKVIVEGSKIIAGNGFSKGDFIRLKGSHINKGDLALSKGTYITPAVIGFLAGLGIVKIKVFRKPEIYVIVTGNELQTPGKKLVFGKVYDSNSFILRSALEEMNLKAREIIFVKDKNKILSKVTEEYLNKADVILISGGISVGKYDFVNDVLNNLEVNKLFYKVSQRPGKPLYFGKKKNTYVFGLPGNPASVFTCFYEYVYPLLRKFRGYDNYFLKTVHRPVLNEINKKFQLSNFLKAKLTGNSVVSLEGQASYILKTFADANCFIYLPADKTFAGAGEKVEVHLFPST